MGSIETAVLLGVAKNHGKELRDIKSWLEDFGGAFADIIHGLDAANSISDASYHRKKIMAFLFVKLFDSDTLVKAFHSKWKDLSEFCDSCVPLLSYHDFFESLSFLGLGTELTAIMEIIDVDVQEVIGQHLCNWIKSKTGIFEDIATNDVVIVTLFIASLVIALKMGTHNGPFLVSVVKKCHKLLLLVTEENGLENSGVAQSNTCFKCMKLMFGVIEFDISTRKLNTTPDVLYLNRLKDTLECSLSKNTLHQAITDLISLNTAQKTEGDTRESQTISPYFLYVEMSLNYLHARVINATLKETCNSLKILLNLDASSDEVDVDSSMKTPVSKNDIFVVTNCLDGYDESAVRLLTCMVKNPLENESWKETIACFQSSPQCLAVKCNLLRIIDIIFQCINLADSDKRQAELSTIASEFQKLFWKGFILLTVKSKYNLAKEIIFIRKDYHLLSECMVKTSESNTAVNRHVAVDHKTKKVMRRFFEKLIDQDTSNDYVRAEFSYMCLLSPSLCMESLVENAFYNRMELFASVLSEWDYLLQFPYEANQPCLFWSKFFDCLKHHFMKEDGKSVDNGMALITCLFEKSSNESVPFQFLAREGFDMFGKSFSSSSEPDPITMKLHLSVLHAFSKSKLFQTIMSSEELLSLCVALGAKIDVSTSSWQADLLYYEDDDLLDDVFEAVLQVAVEQMTHLKDQNYDEFVMITKWISHIVKGFTWSTQLRFLPVLQQVDGFLLSVPACLAEVCKMPAIFRPDMKLCYGTGNGLLAWHQCFVINSNICPIHSLGIEFLEAREIKIFTNAWIVTLAQILPFCKTSQWLKLIETTKLLLSDCKLYCPYQYTQLAWLSNIHIPEVYTLLGVVQVLKGVFDALCNKELVNWYSKLNYVSLSKDFSAVCCWLVSASPEFAKASLLSRAFILSQIFCSVSYVARLIQNVGNNQLQACLETLFILSLELIGTFEKIVPKLCEVMKSDDDKSSDDDSTSSLSYRSSDVSPLSTKYHILELSSRIEEMIQSSSSAYKGRSEILVQKLSLLNKKMDEIRSRTPTDLDL